MTPCKLSITLCKGMKTTMQTPTTKPYSCSCSSCTLDHFQCKRHTKTTQNKNHAQTHGKPSLMQRHSFPKLRRRRKHHATLMSKQNKLIPKLHGKEELLCKHNNHAKASKKNENCFRGCHTCVSYSRGENTIVYHQGRRYFIYEK